MYVAIPAAVLIIFLTLTAASGQPGNEATGERIPRVQRIESTSRSALVKTNQLIKANPKDFSLYIRRGLNYWKLRDLDHAVADFRKSIFLNPFKLSGKPSSNAERLQKLELARAHYDLGCVYCAEQQYKTAIESFKMAIEIEPNLTDAYRNRALAYQKLDQPNRALADSKKCEALYKLPREQRVSFPALSDDFSNGAQNRTWLRSIVRHQDPKRIHLEKLIDDVAPESHPNNLGASQRSQ
jgi:tetratricopeptide (TPR) repeat protein